MTGTETETENPYEELMGERVALYIPGNTFFGTLEQVTEHEIVLRSKDGSPAVYPRGKYDMRKAI